MRRSRPIFVVLVALGVAAVLLGVGARAAGDGAEARDAGDSVATLRSATTVVPVARIGTAGPIRGAVPVPSLLAVLVTAAVVGIATAWAPLPMAPVRVGSVPWSSGLRSRAPPRSSRPR